MEYLVHTCGQPVCRVETGGVAKVVLYADLLGHEINYCQACSKQLCDAELHTVKHEDRETICVSVDGHTRLVLPFRWERGSRAYTYASIDSPLPRMEIFDGSTWQFSSKVDVETFSLWMQTINRLH